MKIMLIGGGGREHAIIKKLRENPAVETIYALPGNGGISRDAQCVSILEANRAEMETVAQYLLEHETMNAAEFEKVFAKEGSPAIEAPTEEK